MPSTAQSAWVRLADVERVGYPQRTLARHVKVGKLPSRKVGARVEVPVDALPPEYQARIKALLEAAVSAPVMSEDVARRLRFVAEDARPAMVAEATRRAGLLQEFAAIEPKRCNGAPTPAVARILANWPATDQLVLATRPSWGQPVALQRLYEYLSAFQRGGADALLPKAPTLSAKDGRYRKLSERVGTLIVQLRLFTFPDAPTVGVWRELKKALEGTSEYVPSLSHMKRWMAEHITQGQHVMYRKGRLTYEATESQPTIRQYDMEVGAWWSGDHHVFDFHVINPSTGKLERPWVTMFLDIRSRAPIGWCLTFKPSSRTIIDAFCHGVQPKAGAEFAQLYGRPDVIYVDNGKDFLAQVLNGHRAENPADRVAVEGLFVMSGAKVVNAIPYNAKAKVVERHFRTLCDGFSKMQPVYWGNSPQSRTERVRDLHKVWDARLADGLPLDGCPFMTFAQLEQSFAAYVVEYLRRPSEAHREADTGRVLSPLQVAAQRKTAPIVPNTETLVFHGLEARSCKVMKGTIRIEGEPYQHAELHRFNGTTVDVRWSRSQPERAYVFDKLARLRLVALHEKGARYLMEGLDTEAAFLESKRRKKAERKTLQEVAAIRHRKALNLTTLDVAARHLQPVPPSPATPASQAATVPSGAIRAISGIDRLARELAAASAAATAPEPPAVPPVDESDEDYVIRVLGTRPVKPRFCKPSEALQIDDEITFWDGERLALLEGRQLKRRGETR